MAGNVPAMIDKAYKDISSQTGTVRAVADQSKIPAGVNAAEWNDAFATMTKPGASPTDPVVKQAQVKINNLMGITDPAKMLTAEALQADLSSSETTIGDALAGHTPETVTLGMLHPEDFGMGSFEEMGQALGLTGAALQKLTVAQLGDVVEKVKSGEFNTEEKWRSLLADPTASAQDRNTARTILRGLGAKGVDVTEANVAKLTAQVKAADRVTFNGTSMTVEQALSSDNVKATVASVLDTNPDGSASINTQKMATLAAGSPQLAKWITDNANALAAVVKNIPPEQKALADVQSANIAAASAIPDISGPTGRNAIMAVVDPEHWGPSGIKLTAETVPPPPMVAALKGMPGAQSAVVIQGMGDMVGLPPEYLKDFANMTPAQLEQSGLADPTGHNMQVFIQSVRQPAAAKKATSNPGSTVGSLVTSIMGGTTDANDLTINNDAVAAMATMGFAIDTGAMGGFMAGVAKGDVGATASAVPTALLASEIAAGKKPQSLTETYKEIKAAETQFYSSHSPVVGSVIQAYAIGHKTIDKDTTNQLIASSSGYTPSPGHALGGLQELVQTFDKLGLPTDAVYKAIDQKTDAMTDQIIKAHGKYPSFDALSSAVNSINAGNVGEVESALSQISASASSADPHLDAKLFPLRGIVGAFKIQNANVAKAAAEKADAEAQSAASDAADKAARRTRLTKVALGGLPAIGQEIADNTGVTNKVSSAVKWGLGI
jgi:hypothetical protein